MFDFCQSCGMPMVSPDLYGSEADGSFNSDYCKYCYEQGSFTMECSIDEMIRFCVPIMVEHNPGMTAEQAKDIMYEFMPKLKRWKQ